MDLHDFTDVAENYDFYIPGISGADDDGVVAFHTELARVYGAQGILDIACGTGVTLIPLIQQGYHVTGIDISSAMLNVLQRKLSSLPQDIQNNARLICASMTEYDAGQQYSLAVIPRSGFMHLRTQQEQERALRTICRHLTDGGVLSFNTFDPNYALIAANLKGTAPKPVLRSEYTNAQGMQERIWNVAEYDPVHQWIEATWIFETLDGAGEVIARRERPLCMRWSFEPEIRNLLRLCGFEVLATYSSYHKEPRSYSGSIIWEAVRLPRLDQS
ncbi:MAG: class I SAM-dependent methyltransferase [Chloroflexi bacterium]|nr:class I SAM-dependent methyltransferase [Chloroflexota bacterium]